MTKHEIDEMMADLPSQHKKESVLAKVVIGMMFILFLVFWLCVPDFESDCFDQVNNRVSCESQAN
jgi:hypothetical protein